MTDKTVLTEQDAARVSGPIALKEPGSPQWCWQQLAALQTQWRALNFDYELYMRTWDEAESHQIWDKVPYDAPYGSKERMLEALEIGDIPAAKARVMEKAMTAAPLGEVGDNQHTGGYTPEYTLPNKSSTDYLIARIARDRPDIWERMKRGDFDSVAAAAREAGIITKAKPKTMTLSNQVDRVAERLHSHYEPEQFVALARRMMDLYEGRATSE